MRATIQKKAINETGHTLAFKAKSKLRFSIGKALEYFYTPVAKKAEIDHINYVMKARSPGDRLSREEVETLASYQTNMMDLQLRKDYFKEADGNGTLRTKTLHGLVIDLLEQILESDPSVQSVMDIGCNYAYIDHQFALRYPEKQFYGVDVPRNLLEFNNDLSAPNLKLTSGYALELLESGAIGADVVYFSSTAAAIKLAELKNYLRLLSQRSKYVVFNEPLFHLPDGSVVDPLKVSSEESFPVHVVKAPLSGEFGYVCRAHNYKAIMEQAGFDVAHYEVWQPDFTDIHWIRIIGQNNNAELWV